MASPASAQSVNAMIQHQSGEPTVEIATTFPRGKGCGIRFYVLDTVDVTVNGWVDASSAVDTLPPDFAAHVLGAVRRRLHLPAVMSAGVFGPDTVGYTAISGAVAFTLDLASTVHGVHMASKSTSTTLDDVLPEAVNNAAHDHLFPPLPPSVMNKGVDMVVTLSTVLWGSGSPADILGATPPLDMFGVTLERYRGMRLADGLQVPPGLSIYTPETDSAGGAPVWVQFVLGSDGHVTPGTLRIVGSQPPAVIAQIVPLIMKATMTPAMISTCPVPQLIRAAIKIG
jgi:hypothetical protein